MNFICNILVYGKIECLTGLHIGGNKEKVQIGGVDSPVIRDPASSLPYIPGSSLKGKMRMHLEFAEGKVLPDNKGGAPPHNCDKPDCPVCRVFGSSADNRSCGPTRLTIRDAYPDRETITMWEQTDSELLYTEMKAENFIDRITSAAMPRFLERVVKGSVFDLEMVYGCYDVDKLNDIDFFEKVFMSLKLVEHSALGGNISRGYGQIRFLLADPIVFTRDEYQKGIPEGSTNGKYSALSDISFENFKSKVTEKLGGQ